MTFERYIHGSDEPQPIPDAIREPAPSVRIRDTKYSVSSNDGAVTETKQTDDRGTVSELNQHFHGASAILATVQRPDGRPVYEIEGTDLVIVNGVQASVNFWCSEGVLQKRPDGTYAESTGRPAEAPRVADTSDYFPVSDSGMAAINGALEPIPDGSLDSLAGVGMGMASGRLEMSHLVERYAQITGAGLEESGVKVGAIVAEYQKQADAAMTSRFGIASGDLKQFYQWAKQNMPGQLGEAAQMQMRQHNLGGYRAIAERWKAVTPPSAAALQAAGHPTRVVDSRQQVFIRGSWMSPGAAGRMGLV